MHIFVTLRLNRKKIASTIRVYRTRIKDTLETETCIFLHAEQRTIHCYGIGTGMIRGVEYETDMVRG